MIGVIADRSEHATVKEFFELFKTPWEFYESGRSYEVLLCAGSTENLPDAANVKLLYSSRVSDGDVEMRLGSVSQREEAILAFRESRLPIYGKCLLFPDAGDGSALHDEATGQPALWSGSPSHGRVIRIGYDLFREVRHLLTVGQPAKFAAIPTLELHIELLRELIISAGVALTEIPPIPEGYKFIVCLTHDVDHPSIRRHTWDRTVAGFLYRATLGSLRKFLARSISLRELLINLAAAFRLPLVHLGLAKDFWRDFVRRYGDLEGDLCSTYFIIPFEGRCGREAAGPAPGYRAAGYGADDIRDLIGEIRAAGGEVGLHGIDAWIDRSTGEEELKKIEQLTGATTIGSRIHWLFFSETSPALLEQAGISYDSTSGYRETVGYRAGTTQAYKPPAAERLLELPLHAMDTALFYPAYLGLSSEKATRRLETMADTLERFGGCLTVNWHDRSLSPERLWNKCYIRLLADLKARGAWFATAGQAVAWFRSRRAVVMGPTDAGSDSAAHHEVIDPDDIRLPGLQMRTYSGQSGTGRPESRSFVDAPLHPGSLGRILCPTGN